MQNDNQGHVINDQVKNQQSIETDCGEITSNDQAVKNPDINCNSNAFFAIRIKFGLM